MNMNIGGLLHKRALISSDEDEEDADEIVDREVALRIAEHQRQNEAQSENEIRITLKPGEGRELKIKVFKVEAVHN